MRKFICIITTLIGLCICFLFSFLTFCFIKVPDNFRCFANDFPNSNLIGINIVKNKTYVPAAKNFFNFVDKEQFTAFLFNTIPIKKVDVQNLGEKIFVSPCGTPFGLKILTDGVMIIDLKKIQTENGQEFPANKSGLKKGDLLLSVNNCKINNNQQLKHVVQSSKGKPLTLKIKRNSNCFETKIKPVFSKEFDCWQVGIVVRDSSAGLGTLTFSTKSGFFGGLGHAVADVDTGNTLPIGKGEVVEASIQNVVKSSCAKPGELCGKLLENKPIGNITINTDCGLYGSLNKKIAPHEFIPLGLKHEVKIGKAFIYSTVDGVKSKKYEVEIESINNRQSVKNLIIKVTDDELLQKTGGIVQGMSGSPIIQNNKLVGVITHVFLNDPSRGYGVFAETMLMTFREFLKKCDNKHLH